MAFRKYMCSQMRNVTHDDRHFLVILNGASGHNNEIFSYKSLVFCICQLVLINWEPLRHYPSIECLSWGTCALLKLVSLTFVIHCKCMFCSVFTASRLKSYESHITWARSNHDHFLYVYVDIDIFITKHIKL